MKKNICRPIIFYNNFLPAVKEKHNWEFCAFGTFDGISVEKRIIADSAGEILLKIWDHQKEFSYKLGGKYAAQVVYALCYADEEKEKKFWQKDSLPFTFFCRLQFRKNMDSLRRNKAKLEKKLNNIYNISAMIYTTYDNSDLMIVIKAKYYQNGAGLINAMHQGINFSFDKKYVCELKNSFTVFAIKQDFINETRKKEFREELNKTRITSVSIRIIERECGRIAELCKYLNEQLNGEKNFKIRTMPILGADDEVLSLEKIGWGDFLRLYCEEDGVFNNSCPIYQQHIAGATTTISTKIKEYEIAFEDCYMKEIVERGGDVSDDKDREKYEKYVGQMRQKLDDLVENVRDYGTYKELYMILNALPKFSEEIFSDYIFFAVLRPVNTLLDLLKEGMNDSYYAFIKNFNTYVQNSVKPDRHAIQIIDFNTKIYDVPTKLNAFYTAYIYRVSEILNIADSSEKKHIYDFMVVPGVTNIVNVKELFQKVSPEKRLLRVEIPENRFYDVCNIMIIFAHEAAHYVGTVLRNRKKRYGYVLESVASIYIDYVRSYCIEETELEIAASEKEWGIAKKRMAKMLECMLDREKNAEYLEKEQIGESEKKETQIKKLIENNIRYQEYFSFLKQNLYRAMMDITEAAIPNVFGGITFNLNEEKRQKAWDVIQEISNRFLIRYEESTSLITLDTVLEQLSNLYEESFADLISITLLELDAKDYLNSIIKENKQQKKNITSLYRTETIYRILLVINIMCYENENNQERLNYYQEGEYLEERCIILSAIERMTTYINKGWQECFNPYEYRSCCFYALIDKKIYNKVFHYLLKCQEDFKRHMKEKTQICQKLSNFYLQYKNTKKNNVEEQVAAMELFILDYKKKLFEELEA